MSGIAGIIHFDGRPVEPGQVEAMTAAMHYRGPDGIHHWRKGNVALGHCMLRTTPESLEETQPLTNEDESLVLVMDGRVDNWEELRRELLGKGALLRTRADAELVLRAYEVWGEGCVGRLLGDFAFCVWDTTRQTLFAARDHLGVKPFHFFVGREFFAFASDEEAFFKLPGASREPNEDRIAYLLLSSFEGIDFNQSWVKDVQKLGSGCCMSVGSEGRIRHWKHWSLQPQTEISLSSDAEYEECFSSIFSDAVRCRLRTLGSPLLMLSGGLDSASIAGIVRRDSARFNGVQLHTSSVVSDRPDQCDETRNIQQIVNGFEGRGLFFGVPSFNGGTTDQDLIEAAWARVHPTTNALLLPSMQYLLASRRGYKAMLDGVDGDLVTYAPNHYVSSLLHEGEWVNAWEEALTASEHHTYLRTVAPIRIACAAAWEAFAPVWGKWSLRRARSAAGVAFGVSRSSINPAFAKQLRLDDRQLEWKKKLFYAEQRGLKFAHIHAMTQPGITRGMEGYDRSASHYGVEPRHPWSDKRLVEFFVGLPLRQKVRQGWTKYIVRKTMAGSLPREVAWHSGKDHLGGYFVRRVVSRNYEEMVEALDEVQSGIGRYIDPRKLRALRERCAKNAIDDRDLLQFYWWATLAGWLIRLRSAP